MNDGKAAENVHPQPEPGIDEILSVLGRVSGHMAHDLNNIVTIILSYTQFILDDLDNSHPLREDAAVIMDAGRRIGGLVTQLWSFSGRQTLRCSRIDLGSLARERTAALELSDTPAITVDLVSPPDPLWITADLVLLGKSIDAILCNAIEAMDRGGALRVQVSEAPADSARAGTARLAISDEGCGMSTATMQRLFEPFFTTKPKAGGPSRGLGLAAAYGVIRQCGGSIEFSSEVGRGTRCEIDFPIIGHGHPESATLTRGC